MRIPNRAPSTRLNTNSTMAETKTSKPKNAAMRVGEKLAGKQRKIRSMPQRPRQKLPVRNQYSGKAKRNVQGLGLHVPNFSPQFQQVIPSGARAGKNLGNWPRRHSVLRFCSG